MTGPRHDAKTDTRTIAVKVTFFADLRRFLPRGADGPQPYTVPERATVDELLTVIGVAPDADLIAIQVFSQADRSTPLRDGADVMLLTPMEGGT